MFDKFVNSKNGWLSKRGPESEIVFSSRIRLARNIAGIAFPSKATPKQREKVFKLIEEVYPHIKRFKDSFFVNMDDLGELEAQFLLERHLISQEHLAKRSGRGLIISKDEEISIMINEEDHLRMQVITSGFDLKKCWEILDNIDNDISKKVSFSFLSEIGYLTACPTNVGTGLRASCMLHLPALILTKRINKILELLARISFTTRGLFGEGTQALGDFFQVSNQVSLGLSEEELIDNLISVVNQVKNHEIDARNVLLKKYKTNLEDNVWRALGTLRSARLITSKEAFSHLSILSLGLDLGIIKDIDLSKAKGSRRLLRNLFIMIQPAHLQKIEGRPLKEKERDSIRATILRERLGG